MSEETNANEAPEQTQRRAPLLNERILSSLSRRSVAAHPWHDLEIGNYKSIIQMKWLMIVMKKSHQPI